MNYYIVEINFGHKVKIKMLVTESVKLDIQNATSEIRYMYRELSNKQQTVNCELIINRDFVQYMNFIHVTEADIESRIKEEHRTFLNEDGIAKIQFFEY